MHRLRGRCPGSRDRFIQRSSALFTQDRLLFAFPVTKALVSHCWAYKKGYLAAAPRERGLA